MRRLFLESDMLHQDEVESAEMSVYYACETNGVKLNQDKVFDEVVGSAWHEADRAWEAVKRCDEIYGSSSLVPLCGFNSYTGSPAVMDVMMDKAIKENITGKSVYFLRPFKGIYWDQIDIELLNKCFIKNYLYTLEYNDDYSFVQVDIDLLYKKYKNKK